jgi:ABC-type antimicrobial peptide transport system permease subunit
MTHVLMAMCIVHRALRRNALPSALTMPGVSIGVAAVIAMLAIGQGADDQVSARLYRVANDTGEVDLVTTFDSNNFAVTVARMGERFFLNFIDFDFEAFAYFIELRVQRAVASAGPAPMVALVRLRETK